MRMVSIIWCVGLIALSALGTAHSPNQSYPGHAGISLPLCEPSRDPDHQWGTLPDDV